MMRLLLDSTYEGLMGTAGSQASRNFKKQCRDTQDANIDAHVDDNPENRKLVGHLLGELSKLLALQLDRKSSLLIRCQSAYCQ